eukprot:gnl/TRDRNA2_/TRDRNA2_171460_c0_seq1.p1 gnl/TRDRNA2_/TRDRNA2_171460_c0~~gnl/TRDRNA2_/TRDRNA2_171460_c0_seq1.p1  ORF type:complete len:377 (+),score=66.56 gnl/TRDRNA2_/TRDRNA2_171460_c0_seq1:50-1180(+)
MIRTLLSSVAQAQPVRRSSAARRLSSNVGKYKVLGVARSASKEEIRSAYRALALRHHPDKGGNMEAFQSIQEAYDTLSNDASRKKYDEELYHKHYGQSTPATTKRSHFSKQSTPWQQKHEEQTAREKAEAAAEASKMASDAAWEAAKFMSGELQRHQVGQKKKKKFKVFTKKHVVKPDVQGRHPENNGFDYPCDFTGCSYVAMTDRKLYLHKLKRHRRRSCANSREQQDLDEHMRTQHSTNGDCYLSCDVPGCSFVTTRTSKLQMHKLKRHRKRSYAASGARLRENGTSNATEDRMLLRTVESTLQNMFYTFPGERVWVFHYKHNATDVAHSDMGLFRARAEIPLWKKSFRGDWCSSKKLAQRSACLAVKRYLDAQ